MSTHTEPGPTEMENDEMLMALADGELPEPESSRLLTRIARDPALAERYALFAETRALMQQAYPAEPVPEALRQAILGAPAENVVPFRAPRRAWVPVALAASLALAVGLGGFFAGQSLAPAEAGDPALAAASLLETTPTGGSVAGPGGNAQVLASYETDIGLCRLISLELDSGGAERAMVCREATGWTVALSVIAGSAESFIPASETATALIDTFLDGFSAGSALDPEAEAAALAATPGM